MKEFNIILIDNASTDGSVSYLQENYPEVILSVLDQNYGFCKAVNEGIRLSDAPYVLLLNNDTIVDEDFVKQLYHEIIQDTNIFSCQGKMLNLRNPNIMDDGGDYYNALGWAFTIGKGKDAKKYNQKREIFSSCGGAAIYRRDLLLTLGLFDEEHFAYLEDMDLGYRARIHGYRNLYCPQAMVKHVGSGTTGSKYNEFKVYYSARNNIYLIYKNMPVLQLLLNLPFILLGILIKGCFFSLKKYGRDYVKGLKDGIRLSFHHRKNNKKVRFQWGNLTNYTKIQLDLWVNILKKVIG